MNLEPSQISAIAKVIGVLMACFIAFGMGREGDGPASALFYSAAAFVMSAAVAGFVLFVVSKYTTVTAVVLAALVVILGLWWLGRKSKSWLP